jgi:peroxiredoxin Q/BCP
VTTIQPGSAAPDVALDLHDGQTIRLAQLWAKRPVILFFYPKDNSLVCTKEACAFRDAYEDFVAAGATVVGVSGDSAESHERFASQHRLPFLLATDADGSLQRAFGVTKTLGLIPGRVTFVIDRQGVVRHVFSGQFVADRHVREALDAVRALASAAT